MENSTPAELKRKHHFKNTRKKTPTVFQMEATECGAASLTMILGYFGCNQPLEKMRIECGVSRDGTNAKNIVRAARKYGLETKGYSKEVDELLEMPTPCIIHWNFNHFVVFEGTKGKYVYINDPALGRRKLTYEDLDDSFTGIVLTFNKTDELITQKKNSSLLKFISKRLSNQKKNLLALLLAGLILVVPGIVLPVFSKMFVDDILLGGNTSWLGVMLVAMVGTIAFQGLFTWMKAMLINHLQMKMSLISGYTFLEKMFKLPVDFFNQRYAGDLAQRVTNNDTANNFLTGDLIEMIISVITASFFLILLILYSPILTLVGVLGVLFSVSMSLYFSKELENLSIKGQQDNGKLTGAFYSGISLTSTLKACGAENEYASRLLGIYANTTKTSQKIGRMQQILLALPTSMNDVTNILVVMTGGVMVIKGQLTAGVLVAFSQLLSSFSNPVNNLVSFFQKIQTMKADLSRVEDIENYQVDKEDKKVESDNSVRSKLSGNVDIKNISFGYSSLNPPFINDFSISIKPGQIVALVGGSGSGKSTIAKMISGLYEPWSGEILFDGQRRDEIDEGVINSSVSNVSQSISLFTGTIKDNLTLWNSYMMEQDIVKACKDACIHDTITKLPGAYSHVLAEGGSNLSGGQRQRLEIARALSSNPTVLVMDEATSALDPIVEKEIMDNVRRRGCTCIIVAHRLSTIRDADEIVVLDKGVIVERGNHEQLVKLGGKYARLISMM